MPASATRFPKLTLKASKMEEILHLRGFLDSLDQGTYLASIFTDVLPYAERQIKDDMAMRLVEPWDSSRETHYQATLTADRERQDHERTRSALQAAEECKAAAVQSEQAALQALKATQEQLRAAQTAAMALRQEVGTYKTDNELLREQLEQLKAELHEVQGALSAQMVRAGRRGRTDTEAL